jgi:hypothetical protein
LALLTLFFIYAIVKNRPISLPKDAGCLGERRGIRAIEARCLLKPLMIKEKNMKQIQDADGININGGKRA